MAILIFRHPLKNEDYNLSIVRLYILNEKNPFIKILQSLDLHTIESLKTIEVPKFFKDLFEE